MRIVTAPAGPRQPFFSLILLIMAAVLFTGPVYAQPDRFPANRDAILLTIFLKHDQSKTLDEIQAQLKKQGCYKNFPPQGVEVVSWYVIMGMGQVVTVRVPAARLREVNLAIEHSGWRAFRTEFYAAYDYKQSGRRSARRCRESRVFCPSRGKEIKPEISGSPRLIFNDKCCKLE